MAKLNNVEIHFKHSNRTYNTMTAFLVMTITSSEMQNNDVLGGLTALRHARRDSRSQ